MNKSWPPLFFFSNTENKVSFDGWPSKTIGTTSDTTSFKFVVNLSVTSISQCPLIKVLGRVFITYGTIFSKILSKILQQLCTAFLLLLPLHNFHYDIKRFFADTFHQQWGHNLQIWNHCQRCNKNRKFIEKDQRGRILWLSSWIIKLSAINFFQNSNKLSAFNHNIRWKVF